ncbi:MAG: NYN domain-containing protein [Nitrospira sp.]|nr:NYN domain-containing protein [Nitrospira sp.]
MARNVWLVDMGFVVQAATDGDRFKVDYVAARRFLEQRIGKADVHLFNSIDSSLGVPRGLEAFYGVVKRQGFRVHLVEMTGDPKEGTHRQQGVDEALIAELLAAASRPEIATIVLTSGDAHFVPAVEEAQQVHGTKVILFGYDINVSAKLKAAANEFWPFEEHEPELSRDHRPNERGRHRWR